MEIINSSGRKFFQSPGDKENKSYKNQRSVTHLYYLHVQNFLSFCSLPLLRSDVFMGGGGGGEHLPLNGIERDGGLKSENYHLWNFQRANTSQSFST